MSRRSRTPICPSCALRWRLDRIEADRVRWMREGEARVVRSYWHPYGNDDPERHVDVTGCSAWQVLHALQHAGVVFDFEVSHQARGDLERAMRRGRDVNWPWFGCIRHDRSYDPKPEIY